MTLGSKNAVVPEINKDINDINHNIIVGHVLDKTGLQFKEASHDANNFMLAIKRGDVMTVRRLITEGYDISTIGMFGATPLLTSCQYGYRDISELILNHQNINSTVINHCNEKKVSALLYACMNGDMVIVEKLLILGAKPFPDPSLPIHNPITDSTIALTPLSIAIINGHLPIVKFLLDIRNDINQVFDYPIGKSISSSNKKESGPSCVTPLLLASFYGHVDVVNELLRREADWTLKDDENSSILHHCCRLSDTVGISILDVLKINGCDVKDLMSSFDINGDTPIHVACDHKNVGIVSWLLTHPIDVNIKNKSSGITALHIAIRRRNDAIVKILLSNSADPKIVDNKNVSAIDLASKLRTDNEIYKLINNINGNDNNDNSHDNSHDNSGNNDNNDKMTLEDL